MTLAWVERQPFETIVLATRWSLAGRAGEPVPISLRRRVGAVDALVARLPSTTRVLLFGPPPLLHRPAPECITRGWEDRCSRPRREHEAAAAIVWRELDALAERHPNVALIDPTDYFCDADVCPVVRHGVALYWDDNHVTASAARGFAEAYLAGAARFTRVAAAPAGTGKP